MRDGETAPSVVPSGLGAVLAPGAPRGTGALLGWARGGVRPRTGPPVPGPITRGVCGDGAGRRPWTSAPPPQAPPRGRVRPAFPAIVLLPGGAVRLGLNGHAEATRVARPPVPVCQLPWAGPAAGPAESPCEWCGRRPPVETAPVRRAQMSPHSVARGSSLRAPELPIGCRPDSPSRQPLSGFISL